MIEWGHLCARCDRALFDRLVKRHPLATLRELADFASLELGWEVDPLTVGRFLRACEIRRVDGAELLDRREEARRAERKRKRHAAPKPSGLRAQDRAVARNASIFTIASEVDQ